MSDVEIQVTVKTTVKLPTVPRYLTGSGKKGGTISIADIDPAVLKDIGQQWTEALLSKADEIREERTSRAVPPSFDEDEEEGF